MPKAKTADKSTRDMKPKMPENRPAVLTAPLNVKLMNDFSRYSNGSMAMTIEDVGGKITDSDTGKEVGSIYGAIGGGIVVHIGVGDKCTTWSLNMHDLWKAVRDAVEEQYPAKENSNA